MEFHSFRFSFQECYPCYTLVHLFLLLSFVSQILTFNRYLDERLQLWRKIRLYTFMKSLYSNLNLDPRHTAYYLELIDLELNHFQLPTAGFHSSISLPTASQKSFTSSFKAPAGFPCLQSRTARVILSLPLPAGL